jgi:hypothetical protein
LTADARDDALGRYADIAGQAARQQLVDLPGSPVWLFTLDGAMTVFGLSASRYDLAYIDLEAGTLQPLNNPFGPK